MTIKQEELKQSRHVLHNHSLFFTPFSNIFQHLEDLIFLMYQPKKDCVYRSFSRDVTELISAMLVHIRVTCFSKKYMQTESKDIILLSSQSKIMASEEKKIRLIQTMLFKFHCLITLKSWMGKSESATLRKSRRLESILP